MHHGNSYKFQLTLKDGKGSAPTISARASPSSGTGNPSGQLLTDSPQLTFLCTRVFAQFCRLKRDHRSTGNACILGKDSM